MGIRVLRCDSHNNLRVHKMAGFSQTNSFLLDSAYIGKNIGYSFWRTKITI